MKTIRVADTVGTDREVKCPQGGFTSYRVALEKDGMGFSIHKTVIPKGSPQHWHYKEHLEACYCIAGRGILTDLRTGDRYEILPDTTYLLDSHDDHTFEATEDVILISVFNPPVTGTEVHDEDGSYKLKQNFDYAKGPANDHWER